MEKVNIIVVPQEYTSANHKELWKEIKEKSRNFTVILDIPADLGVSILKRRFSRISNAINGATNLGDNLVLIRPLYLLRPEISNGFLNNINAMILTNLLKKIKPDIKKCQLNILYYDGSYLNLFNKLKLEKKLYYYLMDEVRIDAHNNRINTKRTENDFNACRQSDKIFVMSPKLIENRIEFSEKIKVIGNGASYKFGKINESKHEKTVGLIGNIRNWIDENLLDSIISKNPDIHFGFVGNIEDNMKEFVDDILRKYVNVKYYGSVKKEEINFWYTKFSVLIVPYKQNDFMKATRPIKIVESIFAGTPVVTIPISGYSESSFIKFATTSEEFTFEINKLIQNKIDTTTTEYKKFITENSWETKATEITNEFL